MSDVFDYAGAGRPLVTVEGAEEAGRLIMALLSGSDGFLPKALKDGYRYIGRTIEPKIRKATPQGRYSDRLVGSLEMKVDAKSVRWTFSRVKLRRPTATFSPRTWHGAPFYYAVWRHWGYKDRRRRLRSLSRSANKHLTKKQQQARRGEFRSLVFDPWVWRIVKENEDLIGRVIDVAIARAIRNSLGTSD